MISVGSTLIVPVLASVVFVGYRSIHDQVVVCDKYVEDIFG